MTGTNVAQIAAPSPNVSGGVWRAPLGTTLPTNTTTSLGEGFVSLGYVDDDGVTVKIDRPNTPQYSWGGAKVATLQDHYNLSMTFKLMQPLDPDVLKAVHSDGNITVTAATDSAGTLTTTLMNPTLNVNSIWVIEGGYELATMRIVIPIARISATADLRLTHKALAVYDATLEAFPDASGNFAYQYWDDGILAPS
jgi:hypothetical protein